VLHPQDIPATRYTASRPVAEVRLSEGDFRGPIRLAHPLSEWPTICSEQRDAGHVGRVDYLIVDWKGVMVASGTLAAEQLEAELETMIGLPTARRTATFHGYQQSSGDRSPKLVALEAICVYNTPKRKA